MLSVQVNTQLHYFILPAVCWLVFGPGDHVMTVSSAFSPISPAARQTVSSTIKGCAIMKGALAEAIYFSAQCRKVSPALIFQCRLCVLYSAIKGGIRRTHTSWTNEVGGGASKHKATFHHSWKSILIWIFLLIYLCVFIFFLNYFINAHSVCALPPLGFFSSPTFASLLCSVVHPPPPAPLSPLFLCSFCSSEVYWINADSWNAEDKRGAQCSSQRNGIAVWMSERCVCVRLLQQGEGSWCRGYRQRKWGALCVDVSPERAIKGVWEWWKSSLVVVSSFIVCLSFPFLFAKSTRNQISLYILKKMKCIIICQLLWFFFLCRSTAHCSVYNQNNFCDQRHDTH